MITVEFLITSLIVVLIPGTGVVFTVSTGLAQGRKASVFATLGCTAGIVPHLLATVLGLAALMHTSAVAFQASPLAQLLVLSGVFMAMTFGVFVVYGLLAHVFRRAVIESPRVQSWLRRGFAATFAGLGVQLAVTER
jgi:threonine/homoserine/homoserine lactone efflux protein